jgi:hypothetical protein
MARAIVAECVQLVILGFPWYGPRCLLAVVALCVLASLLVCLPSHV